MPHYLRISNTGPLPDLSRFAPYRAVVVVEQVVSNEWRNRVSEMLCHSGCREMMAWGHDCSIWDDAVDWANLEQFDFGEVPDDSFVFTSWYEDKTLDEVFCFAKGLAEYTDEKKLNAVILHVCEEDRQRELLCRYYAAE